MKKLTFFIGSHIAPNSILDVTNIGWMLKNKFELDLVAKDCAEVEEYFGDFNKYTFQGDSKVAEVRALFNYLKNNDTDAVIQMTAPTQHGWIVSLLTTYAGCKFVYRNDNDSFYSYRPRHGMEKLKYFGLHNITGRWPPKLADKCIVLGPSGKMRLVDRGVDEKRIGVLPPSIQPERITARSNSVSNLDHIEQDNVVLFIGRLNRLKGFDFLMEAIPKIVERRDDIHFLILGSGEQPELSDELESHVTFTGFVQPSEVGGYLEYGDVLTLPSLREAFGRVLLEALCADLRVIGRDVGDVSSITRNTFIEMEEFIEMVCSFEELPQESAENFYRENLQSAHVEFFREL
jgi:glycosyltransferase involved in cell wall biosynthesis